MIVRRLWDAGLAHRDIKPANLLVRRRSVFLIDVAFMQVRPSPWRQAVDLANMMLVLARAHRRRARLPAGAAASSRPTRSPRRSPPPGAWPAPRSCAPCSRQDGRDLLAQFRALAPDRKPIALQRWSLYRVALAAGAGAWAPRSPWPRPPS